VTTSANRSATVAPSRMNRPRSAGCLVLAAACFAAAAAAAAERVSSHYGDVSAASRDEGTFVISLHARPGGGGVRK
jgi:hypothetical protein